MSKTPILMMKDHVPLQEMVDHQKQRMTFLAEELENLLKRKDASMTEFWDRVYEYLETKVGIQEARAKDYSFESGVLYQRPKGSSSDSSLLLLELLKTLVT